MPQPSDVALLAALESQYWQLETLIARLEAARASMIPPNATFWLGSARLAYDSAMSAVAMTVDATIAALRSAHESTGAAVREVRARG